MGGRQGRLRLPPQAAQAEGLPEGADAPMNQSREAHRSARPLHSPKGGQTSSNTGECRGVTPAISGGRNARGVAGGNAREV
jgi:hypothetical protein